MNVVTNTTMTLYFKVDVLFYFSVFGDTEKLSCLYSSVVIATLRVPFLE